MAPKSHLVLKRLAEKLSKKQNLSFSVVSGWLRCRLSFALLRTTLLCVRATRQKKGVCDNNIEIAVVKTSTSPTAITHITTTTTTTCSQLNSEHRHHQRHHSLPRKQHQHKRQRGTEAQKEVNQKMSFLPPNHLPRCTLAHSPTPANTTHASP